jgi:hypothetical protein
LFSRSLTFQEFPVGADGEYCSRGREYGVISGTLEERGCAGIYSDLDEQCKEHLDNHLSMYNGLLDGHRLLGSALGICGV